MGALMSRKERQPRCGLILEPPPRIRGSEWHDEQQLQSLTTSKREVSLVPFGTLACPSKRIDWSATVVECCAFLEQQGSLMSGSSWLDSLVLAASALAKIDAPRLATQPGESGTLVSLKGDRSVLKMKNVPDKLIEELVARHPIVTSLRCSQGQGRVIDPGFRMPGVNPYPWYNGEYNLDCIPRCAVLVGYDVMFWTIFDPAFHVVYNVSRYRGDIHTGVGEILLLPM